MQSIKITQKPATSEKPRNEDIETKTRKKNISLRIRKNSMTTNLFSKTAVHEFSFRSFQNV